jgi:hypothetical protein
VTGIEVAIGYMFAWAIRKAGRVAGRADAEVDRGLDAGMDRLHDLVGRRLGQDPVLRCVREEAKVRTLSGPAGGVSATGEGQAFSGSVDVLADRGSAAAVRMGDVTVGHPPQPGPHQG